jgi:hypothetical protein
MHDNPKKVRFKAGYQFYATTVTQIAPQGYWFPRLTPKDFEQAHEGMIAFEVNHKHKKMIIKHGV